MSGSAAAGDRRVAGALTAYTFVTSSSDKLEEAEGILGFSLASASIDLPEIQGVELEGVIAAKARAAYEALGGKPVLVEDTGLFIRAWGGLPGALVRWFLERPGPAGLCRMLDPIPDRTAIAVTLVGTYDGDLRTFSGETAGTIARQPSGSGGFGWDSIFIPEGEAITFAAMDRREKNRASMRRKAFLQLRDRSTHPGRVE